MKIIFAGNTGVAEREHRVIALTTYRLFSYYFIAQNLFNSADMMDIAKRKVDLFLDSGAFSAWSQGVEININDYINFIKEHKEVIDIYANLDVISGSKIGNETSAKQTLENQKIMEKAGLSPLPTFHYGEPVKYLKHYLKNYDYIALGGMVPISNKQLVPWLDDLFGNYICDKKGIPKVKIHGFGLTSLKLMLRYPWYSVDSTSWVVTGRMGSIMVPRYKSGKWIYDENSWKVSVSSRSPGIKDDPEHIDNISPLQKKIILEYINAKGYKLGKSSFKKVPQQQKLAINQRWAEKKPKDNTEYRLVEIIEEEGVSNRYQLRDEMNIIYYQDLEKSMPKWPWPFVQQNKTKTLF